MLDTVSFYRLGKIREARTHETFGARFRAFRLLGVGVIRALLEAL